MENLKKFVEHGQRKAVIMPLMSTDKRIVSPNEPSFWLFLCYWALFGLLPVVLGVLGVKYAAWQFQELSAKTVSLDSNLALYRLAQEGDNQFFIQKELNFLYGRLAEEKPTPKKVNAACQRLKSSHLSFLNVYLFDQKAEFVSLPGEKKLYRSLVKKIFLALAEPEMKRESRLIGLYRPFFESFLGVKEPSELVYQKSSLVKVTLKGKPGYFYWNTFYSLPPQIPANGDDDGSVFLGGLVAFFKKIDVPSDLAFKVLVPRLNKQAQADNRVFGLLDRHAPSKSLGVNELEKTLGWSNSQLAWAVKTLNGKFKSAGVFREFQLHIEQVDSNRILFIVQSLASLGNPDLERVVLALAMGFLVFVWFKGKQDSIVSLQLISIRRHLPAYFVSVIAIPVFAFSILGLHYILEKRQGLVQEQLNLLGELTENIDATYSASIKALERIYRRFSKLDSVSQLNRGYLRKLVDRFVARDYLSQAFIVDSNGQLLFHHGMKKAQGLIRKFVPTFARKIFSQRPGFSGGGWRDQASDMMMNSLSHSFSELMSGVGEGGTFSKIFEVQDSIVEFRFGRGSYFLYTTFIQPPGNVKPWLLILMNDSRGFAQGYVNRIVRRNMRQNPKMVPIRLAMAQRNSRKGPVPANLFKYPFARILFEKVVSTETQHHGIGLIGGEDFLVVASPMKQLQDFVFFAMYPIGHIDAAGYHLLGVFFLVSIVSVAVALGVSFVLARQMDLRD